MSHTQNIDFHKRHCCLVHGCIDAHTHNDPKLNDLCPIYNGTAGKSKKHPCDNCKELYGESRIMFDVKLNNGGDYFFDTISKIRSYITSNILGGQWGRGTKYHKPHENDMVTEFKLVPIRTVPLARYVKEYEAFKRFK